MPDTPAPSTHKLRVFRRAYYAADSVKSRGIATMLSMAMADVGAEHVLREYLRLETEQHKQAIRMLRMLTPNRSGDQMPLPFSSGREVPTEHVKRIASDYTAAEERKAQLFETLVRIASSSSTEGVGALRECLRLEVRQHRLVMRMLQALTPRAAISMSTRILNLMDGKPGQVWPFSVMRERLLAQGHDDKDIENNMRQALHFLVHDRVIEQPGRGLYCLAGSRRTITNP